MTEEISRERQEALWEWCGWHHWDSPNEYIATNWWHSPDKTDDRLHNLPPIDLNSLFKFAVPKLNHWELHKWGDKGETILAKVNYIKHGYTKSGRVEDKDPAIALFLVIEKVME